MLDKETKAWLAGIFSKSELKAEEIHKHCSEILHVSDEHGGDIRPELFYELAQANSDAAFYLLQLYIQKKFTAAVPPEFTTDVFLAMSSLFPFVPAKRYIAVQNGEAFGDVEVRMVEKPQAFRFLQWGTSKAETLSQQLFSFDKAVLLKIKEIQTISQAALIAGVMKKSYELSYTFAFERIQGGRLIKDWSLVQELLAELHIEIKKNEKLIPHLSEECALNIFRTSDQFESRCMQIMGGAGYTEDYLLEKYFREIHFLKNWPEPFGHKLINFYKSKVLSL